MIRKEKPGKPISQIEAELSVIPGQPGRPIGKLPKPIGRPIAPGKPKPKPIKPGKPKPKPKPIKPGKPKPVRPSKPKPSPNKGIYTPKPRFTIMAKRMNDPNGFYNN
jgi:hypothetical protein